MLGLAELANGGITTVHNWSHNNRSAEHVNAELQAHRNSLLRARYSIGILIDCPSMSSTRSRIWTIQGEWFDNRSRLDGVNLRGMVQSDARVFHT